MAFREQFERDSIVFSFEVSKQARELVLRNPSGLGESEYLDDVVISLQIQACLCSDPHNDDQLWGH